MPGQESHGFIIIIIKTTNKKMKKFSHCFA